MYKNLDGVEGYLMKRELTVLVRGKKNRKIIVIKQVKKTSVLFSCTCHQFVVGKRKASKRKEKRGKERVRGEKRFMWQTKSGIQQEYHKKGKGKNSISYGQ